MPILLIAVDWPAPAPRESNVLPSAAPVAEEMFEQHLMCFQWNSKTQAVVVPRSVTCYPASSRGHDEHRRLRYPNQESRNAGPG